MKSLREIGIKILCGFGKFGVGKSLTLGMYDFETPKELLPEQKQDDDSDFDKNIMNTYE